MDQLLRNPDSNRLDSIKFEADHCSMLLTNSKDPFISSNTTETNDYDISLEIPKITDKKMFYFHNFKYKKDQPLFKKDSSCLFQKSKFHKKIIRPEIHLPFMGTISLENLNQKPRRGRKPSPAASSIINLIQKNYGIDVSRDILKSSQAETVKCLNDEPLNLCVRDPHINLNSLNGKAIKKKLESQRKNKALSSTSPEVVCKDTSKKNEVSICKFKLANGSLQEKKIFSVVNGNFNCGNATKTNQLKRHTLKESFKASKSKISNKESQLSIESNSSNINNLEHAKIATQCVDSGRGGFLIQTQEQTSNQCGFYKFRHLKTISRYLFRNWKNYLPPDSKVDKKMPLIN